MTHISSFMFKIPSMDYSINLDELKEISRKERHVKTVNVIDMATKKEDRNVPIRDALVKYG